MDKYRKFEFASLRNSKLTDGFWGKRTDNYCEILYLIFDYPHKHYTFKYFEV